LPRFVAEGYAIFKGGDFYIKGHDGLAIVLGQKPGFREQIAVAENAPKWAHVEYEELAKVLDGISASTCANP
jgi:hypothetical protein